MWFRFRFMHMMIAYKYIRHAGAMPNAHTCNEFKAQEKTTLHGGSRGNMDWFANILANLWHAGEGAPNAQKHNKYNNIYVCPYPRDLELCQVGLGLGSCLRWLHIISCSYTWGLRDGKPPCWPAGSNITVQYFHLHCGQQTNTNILKCMSLNSKSAHNSTVMIAAGSVPWQRQVHTMTYTYPPILEIFNCVMRTRGLGLG